MRLLTLPLTLARVPAELGMDLAKRLAGTAVGAARMGYGVVAGGEERSEPGAPSPKPAAPSGSDGAPSGNGRPPDADDVVLDRDPVADAQAAVASADAVVVEPQEPPAAEPVHVSEEPELVAEVAERGAEAGAGAEVRLEEPWPGYDTMTAADIVDRLVTEDEAAAAAVSLYEAAGKGRSSVLKAASRSMRS